MSQRMIPPSVVETRSGTFERDPPGWPDWRRLSIKSMLWSIRSPTFCHWAKCLERASNEGFWRVCIAARDSNEVRRRFSGSARLPRRIRGNLGRAPRGADLYGVKPMPPDHPRTAEALLSQSDWVRSLVRGLGVDESGAEDVLQSTWIAALTRPPRTSGESA